MINILNLSLSTATTQGNQSLNLESGKTLFTYVQIEGTYLSTHLMESNYRHMNFNLSNV